jgi:yecA family protein
VAAKRIDWDMGRNALPRTQLPPDVGALGVVQFTLRDRATLSDWLAEDGWPRWRMDIAMLEGYLVGLLVWPVAIAPGAWLPPIWGVAGWKVPPKIKSPDAYRKFEDLVVGYLHYLEFQISTPHPGFIPTLSPSSTDWHPRAAPGIAWAQGFIKALQQGLQGLRGRSDRATSAVTRIAHYASAPMTGPTTQLAIAAELAAAVAELASERISRGPLGEFIPPKRKPVVTRAAGPVVTLPYELAKPAVPARN